jgi:hypothetical protein
MKSAHGRYLGFLLALLVAGTTTAAEAGERRNFLVKLEGSFAEFVMYCKVLDGGGTRIVQYSELMPNSYRIAAEAVSCTIALPDRNGQISAKLYENGKLIADAEEKATRPILKLRSGGPWGRAKGVGASAPARLIRLPAEGESPAATAGPRDLIPR